MSKHFTIFGGNGFVGGEVASLLEARGDEVLRITRDNWPEKGADLGTVIFTIGMTADFRTRLVETVDMQVVKLYEALTRYKFDNFTYLSSARVYADAESTNEQATLLVKPHLVDHIYNTTKLAAESLCLAFENPKIRVARMSNVYGVQDVSNLFLTAVMREAVETGGVTIGQATNSSKDYIHVAEVAQSLVKITEEGKHGLYNIAAGVNVTHQQIADILHQAGYSVTFKDGGTAFIIPEIDNSRFREEFQVGSSKPEVTIARVLNELKQRKTA